MKLLFLALCIAFVAVAAGKQCQKNDECEKGECCVTYSWGILAGKCKPQRKEGESCTPLTKKGDETPDAYHFQCPCKTGLNCEASHEIEVFGHIVKLRPECVVPGGDGDDGIEIVTPEAN